MINHGLFFFLLYLGISQALDLTSVPLSSGINVKKIQNLMKIVDPKSCGCARPDQHCEVPVPEAKFVGFKCTRGQFCCRRKRKSGPIDIKTIPSTLADVDHDDHVDTAPIRVPPTFVQTRGATPRQDDQEVQIIEKQNIIRPSTQQPPGAGAQNPVFNPHTTERVITNVESLEPYDLGLPKDIEAYIRPVSKLSKRKLNFKTAGTTTTSAPDLTPTCRCEPDYTCPAEKRDYITFRKSCPYGQVQCCRVYGDTSGMENILLMPTSPNPVDVNIRKVPASVSQIRPVHIPIEIVSTTTTESTTTSTTTTTTTTTTTSTSTVSLDSSSESAVTFFESLKISTSPPQQTTEESSTPAQTTPSVSPTPSTPAPVTFFSATPYTIVSSTYTVSKLEWQTDEDEAAEETTQATTASTTTPATTTTQPSTTAQPQYPKRVPIFIPNGNNQKLKPFVHLPNQPPRQIVKKPPAAHVVDHHPTGHVVDHHPEAHVVPPETPQKTTTAKPQTPGVKNVVHKKPSPHTVHKHQQVPQQPVLRRPQQPQQPPRSVVGTPVFVQKDNSHIYSPLHPHHPRTSKPIFIPHGAKIPPGFIRVPATVPGQVVHLGHQRPHHQAPPRRWPMTEYLQPPPKRIIPESTGRQFSDSQQLGFVESVGQAAINAVSNIFSWG